MSHRRKLDPLWADVERTLGGIVADDCAELGSRAMTPTNADFLDAVIAESEKHDQGFTAKVSAAVERRRRARRNQ